MARKPSQATIDSSPVRTSQSITADIAEFRKRGGRIQVLGNTPLRSIAPSPFRSDASRRKAATPPRKKSARP